jgi:hypothetical protein
MITLARPLLAVSSLDQSLRLVFGTDSQDLVEQSLVCLASSDSKSSPRQSAILRAVTFDLLTMLADEAVIIAPYFPQSVSRGDDSAREQKAWRLYTRLWLSRWRSEPEVNRLLRQWQRRSR